MNNNELTNKSILLAKKYLVENIYSSVKIEGLAMTFLETQSIIEHGRSEGKSFEEVHFVNDLKNAWRCVFENIYSEINIDMIKKLNRTSGKFTVTNAGSIRTSVDEPIFVRGESGSVAYEPPLPPSADIINDEIQKICNNEDKISAAIDLYLYLARGQFFNDGNKRTALLACNMALIKNGKGILYIPIEKDLEFKKKLIDYYVTEDKGPISDFLRSQCFVEPMIASIGQDFQRIRENEALSRLEMAEILGLKEKDVYDIERNRIEPSNDTIKKLEDYLHSEVKIQDNHLSIQEKPTQTRELKAKIILRNMKKPHRFVNTVKNRKPKL